MEDFNVVFCNSSHPELTFPQQFVYINEDSSVASNRAFNQNWLNTERNYGLGNAGGLISYKSDEALSWASMDGVTNIRLLDSPSLFLHFFSPPSYNPPFLGLLLGSALPQALSLSSQSQYS